MTLQAVLRMLFETRSYVASGKKMLTDGFASFRGTGDVDNPPLGSLPREKCETSPRESRSVLFSTLENGALALLFFVFALIKPLMCVFSITPGGQYPLKRFVCSHAHSNASPLTVMSPDPKALEAVVLASTRDQDDAEALSEDLHRLREQLLVLGRAGSRLAALGRPEAAVLAAALNGHGGSEVDDAQPSNVTSSLNEERRSETRAALEVSEISRPSKRDYPLIGYRAKKGKSVEAK